MKAIYQSPRVYVHEIVGQTHLMSPTLRVGSSQEDKVNSTSDIGFVKGERQQRGEYNVWNEDWSK